MSSTLIYPVSLLQDKGRKEKGKMGSEGKVIKESTLVSKLKLSSSLTDHMSRIDRL